MFRDPNEVGNDTGVSPPSRAHRINSCVEQLRDELQHLLDGEALQRAQIQRLETELSAFKRAYSNVDNERQQLQSLMGEAEKHINLLENQLKGHRIVTLLDGDGAIFTSDLIAKGQAGGHFAAQRLSDAILQFLTVNYGGHQYQLWVYIFFNKRGLMDTYGRAGNWTARTKFEEFYMGFNEAAEKFIMVDVGSRKEAADAKIKAHLEADISLPQTYKVIFGGCHDNGYVTNLRSQITAGFKHKLILLPTYSEVATGIAELDLPALTIPELFLTQKLGMTSDSSTPPGLGSPSWRVRPTQTAPAVRPSVHGQNDEIQDTRSVLGAEPDIFSQQHPSSYSSAVNMSHKRVLVPDIAPTNSTGSDDNDEELNGHTLHPFNGSRRINPNLRCCDRDHYVWQPLTKQNPPPCTFFYLANCKSGASCKYGHDYKLEPEHYKELQTNAKKTPCSAVNNGEICGWGEKCCWGHYCPLAPKCHFLKMGRCRFVGADMHKDPKNQDAESF